MEKYLFYILAGILGIVMGSVFGRRCAGGKIATKSELKEMRTQAQKSRKAKVKNRKQAILEYARKKGTVTNDEAEAMFCISNSSAFRYLDELEKEGKLEQVGSRGRDVYYIPVK